MLQKLSYSSPFPHSPSHTCQCNGIHNIYLLEPLSLVVLVLEAQDQQHKFFGYESFFRESLRAPFTCKSSHKMTFSKFDSFACAFQGTIFEILLNISKRFNDFDLSFAQKVVGSAIRTINLRELTCQYLSHIRPGAKQKRQAWHQFL